MEAEKLKRATGYGWFLQRVDEIQNPYWDEVSRIKAEARRNHHYGNYGVYSYSGGYDKREELVKKYAWAITNPDAVAWVASWLKPQAIEVGAGTGYWGWLMEQLGINMLCYDKKPPALVFDNEYHCPFDPSGSGRYLQQPGRQYTQVLQGNQEVLKGHGDRTLFLCWPPHDDPFAAECLVWYRGNRVVYIGEGRSGCTGDDVFHAMLEQEWKYVAGKGIENWMGIHDHIFVYERK